MKDNNIVSSSTGTTVTNASENTSVVVPPIPLEVIFSILLCLPADILYHVMRYVCRQWRSIIHSHTFVSALLARSSTGLLVRDCYYSQRENVDFLEMTEGGVKMSKVLFPFPCAVSSSCNGLVLAVAERLNAEGERYHVYHLVNPLTKVAYMIPSLHKPSEIMARTAITYVASVEKYKVVRSYYDEGFTCICTMLTVGIDKAWRQIKTDYISHSVIGILDSIPKSAQGAFYWAEMVYPYVLKLDAETEIFHLILLPVYQDRSSFHFAIKGNSLSLITRCSTNSWNVWVLQGSSTKDWIKLHNINLACDTHASNLARLIDDDTGTNTLYPSNWMKDGELLVFHLERSSKCIVYNVKTEELSAFEREREACYHSSLQHVSSLVSLNSS